MVYKPGYAPHAGEEGADAAGDIQADVGPAAAAAAHHQPGVRIFMNVH